MNKEDRELANEIVDETKAVVIGTEVCYAPLSVGGKSFHFDAYQIRFLWNLQRFKGNIEKSCDAISKSLEWANKFLTSRKFREFRNSKLASLSVTNGDLVEWWWQFGLDGAKGKKEWYEGVCQLCDESNVFTVTEAEMFRQDDMSLRATCKICLQPILIELHEEAFKPSREQVQFWSELGNRKVPKIERVQHEFSSETYNFISDETV